MKEFAEAKRAAEQKRDRIIKLYGDADGARRSSQYLSQLIAEELAFRRLIVELEAKEKPAT